MSTPDIYFVHLGIKLNEVGKSINVFGVEIAFYGMIIAFGMLLAIGYVLLEAKRTNQKLDYYYDLAIAAIIFGIIGARIYYVIFEWDLYKNDLLSIFNLRNGGLGIYGGIILGAIAAFVYCKIMNISFLKVTDTALPAVLIGQMIGRWGNFFNREAFGEYTDSLFAMRLKVEEVSGVISKTIEEHTINVSGVNYIQVHPTFLYESFACLVLFIIIMILKRHKRFHGEITCYYMIGYGIIRFMIESLRTDQLTFAIFKQRIAISQVVSVTIVLIAFIMYLVFMKKNATEKDVEDREESKIRIFKEK